LGSRPRELGERRVGSLVLIVLRGLAWFYWIQPRCLQLFWGKILGIVLLSFGFRGRVVRENLERAFPQRSDEQQRLVRASYIHLGNVILEILLLLGPMKKFVSRWMKVKNLEYIRDAKSRGNGIIFLSSHLGNWEIMAVGGVILCDLDLMMVTKQLKPHWLHRAIEQGRLKCGVKATYEPRTLKDVLRHLKNNGAVGIVIDQYVGPPVGVRVPVFGTPVGTSQLIATLAKRTGATVLPAVNHRNPDGSWVLEFHPPVVFETADDAHFELASNTARYSEIVEKTIYCHPEQWLWSHRRFKGDLSPLTSEEWLKPRVRK